MNISKITRDSIKYPLSNWKNFLILGIIFAISNLAISIPLGSNIAIAGSLGIIGFLIGLLANGYLLRIIKSSLAGDVELPEFNAWVNMFIDGIKVIIVGIVYLIPVWIICIFTILLFGSALLDIILANMASNPPIVDLNRILNIGILILIATLYIIIILPISLIATTNMAHYDSKLSAAFRFKEIFSKITDIGWINFIIWYIVTGIIYLALLFIGVFIASIFDFISPVIGEVLIPLILVPYTLIYITRSVSLVYKSG